MFDTSRIHPMLDKVQAYLGTWLEDHLKQIYPTDWWDKCVMSVLVPEQRERALDDGARTPADLDLGMQITVFRGNWTLLRRKFHINPQLLDDAATVKRIRNKYSHKKSGKDYEDRFEHDLKTVNLFLKGLGAPESLLNEGGRVANGLQANGCNSVNRSNLGNQENVVMSYRDRVNGINPISFKAIIDIARQVLPDNIRKAPWIGLEHGVVPLDTEQKLDQYLAAYGKMHVEKIRMSFGALETPNDDLRAPVSIIDWGCGQALATCSLFDWLREENNIGMGCIRRVHLIEPSNLALERACINVEAYQRQYNADFDVRRINRFINDVRQEDFGIDGIQTTVHLLSNILDITTVDLDSLAEFIKHNFTGRQIFFCVGPLNQGASRIKEFAGKFGIPEKDILSRCQGRLTKQHSTISMLTFIIDEGVALAKKTECSPTAIVNVQDYIALQRVIRRYKPMTDVKDRIIQFYQMATELEQIKEPSVREPKPFTFTENNGTLQVSFVGNNDFLARWQENVNATNKFPKDLHFGFDLMWGGKPYKLLYFIKPVDELRNVDLAREPIELKLRDFSISIGCAESLELTDDKINIVEQHLHSDEVSWQSLGELLERIIGNGATLSTAQINVSFCDKNITLVQIYSELKKLDSYKIRRNPLLTSFLENAEFENDIDSILPEELISVVPMDDSQRKAVCNALNSRVSVVVGPPGCGKTQLILNLLANSIVRGKKVLVASKDNKAVDNVIDRFASFDSNGCFLRFGTKDFIRKFTIGKIQGLLNLAQRHNYNDQQYEATITQLREAHDKLRAVLDLKQEKSTCEEDKFAAESRIKELNTELADIDRKIEGILPEFYATGRDAYEHELFKCQSAKKEIEIGIEDDEREILKLSEDGDRELSEFVNQHRDCDAVKQVASEDILISEKELHKIRNEIEYRMSGLTGFFVRVFGKAKLARMVLDTIAEFNGLIVVYLKGIDDRNSVTAFRNCRDAAEFCLKMEHALNAVIDYRRNCDGIRARITSEINQVKQNIIIKRDRLNALLEKISVIQECLTNENELQRSVRRDYSGEISQRQRELKSLKMEVKGILDAEQEKIESAVSRINELSEQLDDIQALKEKVTSIEFGRKAVGYSLGHYLHTNHSAQAITAYNGYLPLSWQNEDTSACYLAAERFLDVFRLDSVTSLSVRNAFPRKEGLFDVLVIDEASQCDVASALPLILRAKQVVVIGDPMQLRHISRVKPEEELAIKRHLQLSGAVHLKYADASLWDYARNWLPWCGDASPCVLENHYRCHPNIIGYSNEMFYSNLTFGGLNVCTANRQIEGTLQGIIWKDIKGTQVNGYTNVNMAEVDEVIKISVGYANENARLTIGIVTPFNAQAERINKRIPEQLRGRIVVDTVHKFQGDEKDIIIYSLVVTDNSPDWKINWIDHKDPNLVNVAVTRAKQLLVVVGNKTYIRNHSRSNLPLGHLVAYVDRINAQGNTENGNRR